jgi:hypothetical protein
MSCAAEIGAALSLSLGRREEAEGARAGPRAAAAAAAAAAWASGWPAGSGKGGADLVGIVRSGRALASVWR